MEYDAPDPWNTVGVPDGVWERTSPHWRVFRGLDQEVFRSVRGARTKTGLWRRRTIESAYTERSGIGRQRSSGTGHESCFWNAGSLRPTSEGRRMVANLSSVRTQGA